MEIDLLKFYPKSKRPVDARAEAKTEKERAIARQFSQDYFDGDRLFGYGGYHYHPRFWKPTVKYFKEHYSLTEDAKILDVGCAKGFMLHDFKELMPQAQVVGLDISEYALNHAMESVKEKLIQGSAERLPFSNKSFDLVISINTVHNLPLERAKKALEEIQRVGKKAFVTMDAWRNEKERERLLKWNLTALTYMHVDDWKKLFEEIGYTGDYSWFLVEE